MGRFWGGLFGVRRERPHCAFPLRRDGHDRDLALAHHLHVAAQKGERNLGSVPRLQTGPIGNAGGDHEAVLLPGTHGSVVTDMASLPSFAGWGQGVENV